MTPTRKLLYTLCYEAICTLQPCTKSQIKDYVAKVVYQRGLDSEELFKEAWDGGWRMQNLKPAVVCTEIAPKKHVWTAS